MKNFILRFGGTIASFALMFTALNINTACTFLHHQPKLPQGAAKLRNF